MKELRGQAARALSITVAVLCVTLLLAGEPAKAALAADDKYVWAVSMDNDLFVPKGASDRDFTGGFAITLSGEGAAARWAPLDTLLAKVDSINSGSALRGRRPAGTSVEAGVYGFTPHDFSTRAITPTDRPYASLLYLSSSRLYRLKGTHKALSSSLTVGVLGSDIFEHMQTQIHRAVGTQRPQGWHNQISDGGELTARYQLALHNYWQANTTASRFKTTYFSSVGYITEAGIALSTRQGLISSPDNRFNPELISYGERVNETAATLHRGAERYFWGGITVKARRYNAFLQGQFKDSVHTLTFSEIRPLMMEAWLGYTFSFASNYKASYVIRAQTSEIRAGDGERGHIWGGIVLSRSH